MKKITLFVLFACLLTFSVQSQALTLLGFGPRGGYYKAKDAEDGNFMVGAAARLKLGSIGFEGSIDYKSEEYAKGLVAVRSWPVMASVLIYPIPIVYGIAGMGWYNTTFDYDQSKLEKLQLTVEDATEQQTGWHFGGGVELPFGSTTISADVRYVFLDYDFSEIPGSSQIESNFWVATVSLFWGF